MNKFIKGLPKVELHLHIEGSLEPELMFKLAERNKIEIPFQSVEEVRNAYQFTNLQSFLDIYYQGANVLVHEEDFFDLTWEYLLHCREDNVIHTEIFFDPQTHTDRGIAFETVIKGIYGALEKGKTELGISSQLIMCFLRHLDEDAAFQTLEESLPFKDMIKAVGLDSSEVGHPPEKFKRVFKKARQEGYLTVAHAGEEGPADYIKDAIELLKVSRIDHGVRCVDDQDLVKELASSKMALTVCPLSNTKLKVFEKMKDHNILQLLKKGVRVTINSDDPAYFGGYMNDNFMAVYEALNPNRRELAQFSFNAIEASFISEKKKSLLAKEVTDYLRLQI